MKKQAYQSLVVGWLTLFFIGSDLFVVSPMLPAIGRYFEVGTGTTGWLVTVFSVVYAVLAPVFGRLSDKWGRRQMIMTGLLGFTVANLLTGISWSFGMMIASRMLAGASASMVTSSIFAVIGDVAPAGKGGKWLSIVTSGFLTALWAGTPIGALGSHVFGFQAVFIFLAIICFMLIWASYITWPSKPVSADKAQSVKKGLGPVLMTVIVTMFWACGVYGLYTYLGTGLEDTLDFSAKWVATAIAVYGIGAIIGSLSGGQIADKWHADWTVVYSMLALGISLILIGLLFGAGFLMWLFIFIWPLAGYISFSAFQAYLSAKFSDRRGMAMAWNQTAMYVGISLGSVVSGWVIEQYTFTLVPIVAGVLAFIGVPWLLWQMKAR